MLRHRARYVATPNVELGKLYYRYTYWAPTTPWQVQTTYRTLVGQQAFPNSSAEHSYDVLHKGPPYLEGGPFNKWSFCTDCTTMSPSYTLEGQSGTYMNRYQGSFINTWAPSAAGLMPSSLDWRDPGISPTCPNGENTWGDVSAYGATGWKKYRPGRNEAEAGVFIGEITDTPRMLRGTAKFFRDLFTDKFGRNPKGRAKLAADSWLNIQFGWLPFLSDLRSFYKTWKRADQIMAQLVRDNGQWIRRHGSVSRTVDSTLVSYMGPSSLGGLYPPLGAPLTVTNNAGSQSITRVATQKVWFEALFKYYIPNVESVVWSKRSLAELYGLMPNPALLWELIPWSWLVDWCSNVGDVFANMDPGLAQNLVAKYAYVMGTTQIHFDVLNTVNLSNGSTLKLLWRHDLTRKTRVQANPFGFGLTWNQLSPRQWSILGALGISRSL